MIIKKKPKKKKVTKIKRNNTEMPQSFFNIAKYSNLALISNHWKVTKQFVQKWLAAVPLHLAPNYRKDGKSGEAPKEMAQTWVLEHNSDSGFSYGVESVVDEH